MKLVTVKLYTTDGCHLCEQALAMLNYHNEKIKGFSIQLVEISDSDSLIEKYGIKIPVLAINANELAWPFDLQELEDWIGNNLEAPQKREPSSK